MLEGSLWAADDVLLVLSVVVGNKTDLNRGVDKIKTEALVTCDWEIGYIECIAKVNEDVNRVFRKVHDQMKINFRWR